MRMPLLVTGVSVLAAAWLGPLPILARESFAAHMTMHMAVVAVAAPLLTIAWSGTRVDPVRRRPWLFPAVAASLIELVVVWAWHAPALHHAARHNLWALTIEQASFLAAGLLLWMAAFGGTPEQRRLRAGTGIVALVLTSIHMTLLGALFALANRPLFAHAADPALTGSALDDQRLGGAIMLLAGGAAYLLGGLWLTTRMLGESVRHLERHSR